METILLSFWIAYANLGHHYPVQLFHSANDACYESSMGTHTNVVVIKMVKRYDENSKIKIFWTVNRINCKVSIEHKEE